MNIDYLPAQMLLVSARREGAMADLRCRALLERSASDRALQTALQRELALCGLTESGFSVMAALLAHAPGPMLRADLPVAAGLTTMRADDALTRLEMSGLVQRERDPIDRRLVWLRLTSEGLSQTNEAMRRRIAAAELVTADLSDEELRSSIEISQKLQEGAERLTREHATARK